MLLRRVHQVRAGETLLVHAASGGVGQPLVRWAKHLGATVIATVLRHACENDFVPVTNNAVGAEILAKGNRSHNGAREKTKNRLYRGPKVAAK